MFHVELGIRPREPGGPYSIRASQKSCVNASVGSWPDAP
jgi:hypothetical protein